MIEIVLIMYTFWPPHVAPKHQEMVVIDRATCAAAVESMGAAYDTMDGMIYTLECKARRRAKKQK